MYSGGGGGAIFVEALPVAGTTGTVTVPLGEEIAVKRWDFGWGSRRFAGTSASIKSRHIYVAAG